MAFSFRLRPSRRGGPAAREQDQTVGWFELFYDLVIVAAAGLTNDAFLEQPTVLAAAITMLSMTALCWVWFLTTMYNNLYPGGSLLRRFLMLVQMAAIITASLAVVQFGGLEPEKGLAAYGVALCVVIALIFWGDSERPAPVVRNAAGPIAVSAAICFGGALLAPAYVPLCLLAAVLVSLVPILATRPLGSRASLVLRFDHLRERLGLFVLIILGEGFAQLVHALHGMRAIPNAGVFALTFLVAFALWWIYFEGTFSQGTDLTTVRWRLSLLAHLTLVFGMVGTLDVLVLFTVRQEDMLGDQYFHYFAVCLAMTFASFAALGFTVHRRWDAADSLLVGSAAVVLVLGLLVLPRLDVPNHVVMTGAAVLVIVNALATVIADRSPARQVP